MNGTWIVISESEKELAEELIQEFFSDYVDMEKCVDSFIKNRNAIAEKIAYCKIPFANDENEISNNVIAQIAHSLSEKIGFNGANGGVLTSHILAEDMVRMSLLEWLYINSGYSRKELYSFIFGDERWILSDIGLIHRIVNIKWYDPCIGGGVYPLAIMNVLRQLGIDIQPFIYGTDMNPIYVEATKIRMALTMKGDFAKNYNYIDSFFVIGDALDLYLPQLNLLTYENQSIEFDIVVGNPPYISAGRIDPKAKKRYSVNYPEIKTKMADLYTYFIAHGLNTLSGKGILTYVSPAQFQMSNYGKPIREFIEKYAGVLTIADFNELPVFKNVSAHICVYSLAKGYKPEEFVRFEYDKLPEKKPLTKLYTAGTTISQKNINADGWNFSSGDVFNILNFLTSRGTRLKEYSRGVYSGLKSGCKKAFWLKEAELKDFTDYDLAYMKKMYLPRNIRRWQGEWKGEYFAVIKKDEQLDEDSLLFRHMLLYRDELASRSDVQGHSTWYGLRECNYYDYMFAPKILYPDIATECRFMMDQDGMSIPDGAFFIPEENYYLLGVLNSCIGRYYFKEKCARIGNPQKGGRIRFKKVYVEEFPVVSEDYNIEIADEIAELAKTGTENGALTIEEERRLDLLAMDLYQIPEKYRDTMQEAQ